MGIPCLALGLGLLSTSVESADAAVKVHFDVPQKYTDAGAYGRDVERNLSVLERHIVKLGEQCMRSGESLELRVLDVDLAGRQDWRGGPPHGLRVMREITWPRIDLEYVWRGPAGILLDQRRERVTDMVYLSRSGQVRYDHEELPYEKAMLEDWFERRFCQAGRP